MGNRAIVTTQKEWCRDGVGVYLHWNGGRDSVNAFCKYMKFKAMRTDDSYFLARFAQIACNFFGGCLSCGIVPARCGAGDDNGVYIIDKNFEIVRRFDAPSHEQDEYNLFDMLLAIDERQPVREQIGEIILHKMYMMDLYPISYAEKLEMIKEGTELYIRRYDGSINLYKVLGFGRAGEVVNGHDVEGIPFYNFSKYSEYGPKDDSDIEAIRKNPNSYIFENTEFYWA